MPRAILTDIEGTTSSIRFVKDVLFPYAAAHMQSFLQEHWESDAVQTQVSAIAAITGGTVSTVTQANALLQEWIREDRKATPLKALQGMIWEDGYQRGEYRAHVYDDAAIALKQWHAAGMPLFVYSSGSIKAQKLFFRHAEPGDLTPLFQGYFDTTSGAKQDASSYRNIAESIGMEPCEILFLSDVEAELDAARATGMQTTLLARPEDSDIDVATYRGPHPAVTSFEDITFADPCRTDTGASQ